MSTPEYDELEPDFGEVMGLLREGLPDLPTERPDAGIWAAISTELGTPSGETDGVGSAPGAGSDVDADADADDMVGRGATVRSIESARSWRRPLALLAGAAAVLLVAVPLYLASRPDDGPGQRAELTALAGWPGSGRADLDGRSLHVRVDGSAPPAGSTYELWLLDLEGEELEAVRWVGTIEVDTDGTYDVPDDIDLDEFDVVDVSIEPDDGNPEHSGDSILRGDLSEA